MVDATGKGVIPGIVDCQSHIAADAINEGAVNVSAMVGIKDVLNPYDPNIYWALAGGVTRERADGRQTPSAAATPSSSCAGAPTPRTCWCKGAPLGIKFALGENVKRDRNPTRSRPRAWAAGRDPPGVPGRQGLQEGVGRLGGRRPQGVRPAGTSSWRSSRRSWKESATCTPTRTAPTRWTSSCEVADEMGFKIRTLQHVLEGYKVADEIAAHGAGASTFSDWWAYKVEAYDAIPYNAALMTERGVLVSIDSDSGEEMRHLNQEAAKSMKWGGMAEEPALAW